MKHIQTLCEAIDRLCNRNRAAYSRFGKWALHEMDADEIALDCMIRVLEEDAPWLSEADLDDGWVSQDLGGAPGELPFG